MKNSFLKPRGLNYPGGAPGFDPTHPASANCLTSAYATSSGAFVDLLTGLISTPATAGVPTFVMDGGIGPALQFANGVQQQVYFPSPSSSFSTAEMPYTMSCIFRANSLNFNATGPVLVCNDTLFNSAISFANDNIGGTFDFNNQNAGTGPSILDGSGALDPTVVYAGGTFFGAASLSPNGLLCNLVITDLILGKVRYIQGSTGAAPNPPAFNLRMTIGGAFNGNQSAQANISHASFSRTYISMPQMLEWASDPWSFWYPKRFYNNNFLLGGSSAPADVLQAQIWM